MYNLPTSLKINNHNYDIRSDFRAVLDIITALNDIELNNYEKSQIVLDILYLADIKKSDTEEALKQAMIFINLGKEDSDIKPKPVLMDWEQDFPIIISPINRVLGYECRSKEYVHWWTFIGAYFEIGEGVFSNVVNIRNKKAKRKKLEPHEREFAKENPDLVLLQKKKTKEEQELIDKIMTPK